MLRFHIINFGCRANQADGAVLQEELSRHGFETATGHEQADIVVLNSCTVTAAADYGVRQAARRVHRENPAARILVTGCYAQRCPEELAALPGVEWAVGNSHKAEIARLLSQKLPSAAGPPEASTAASENTQFVPLQALLDPAITQSLESDFHGLDRDADRYWGSTHPASGSSIAKSVSGTIPRILRGDIFAHSEPLAVPLSGGVLGGATRDLSRRGVDRTRPNLKIQDGCNNRCSFCIIPYVRGRSRSLPLADVLRQVCAFCQAGYREVVLSGINLGRYGRDLAPDVGGRWRLAQLVRAILDQTPLERLRLSSVEPMDFTNELLDLMASSPRIAKHIHAPLQSGSERILRLMHRKYHPHNYRDRIQAAFERMPNAAFGADVMVGFPGESVEDFEETRSFIASLPFTYLHVFPFSRRPGTPADKMDGQVNGAVIRERSRILREMAADKNLRFRRQQLGRVLEVVTLSEPRASASGPEVKQSGRVPETLTPELDGDASEALPGVTSALSDNFLNVLIPSARLPANLLMRVKIVSLCEDGLVGEIEQPKESALSIGAEVFGDQGGARRRCEEM